jgi:hypothetical protein
MHTPMPKQNGMGLDKPNPQRSRRARNTINSENYYAFEFVH